MEGDDDMDDVRGSLIEPAGEREVVIRRVFAAPARLLYRAHTTPEHVMRWFGPVGWPLTTCEMDFRVGGRFRFAMTGPDGEDGPPFGGEYLEIVPERTIVYDNGFEAPGSGTMTVTVTFEEADGRTTLTMRTLFATTAMRDEYVGLGYGEGVGSGLDQLVDVVAELMAEERA